MFPRTRERQFHCFLTRCDLARERNRNMLDILGPLAVALNLCLHNPDPQYMANYFDTQIDVDEIELVYRGTTLTDQQIEQWEEHLEKVKNFIETNNYKPKINSQNKEERQLSNWIHQ